MNIAKWNALTLIGATWTLSIFSIAYGALKLYSSGISKEALRVIMSRHVASILFFLVVELYIQISCFYVFNLDTVQTIDIDNGWVDTIKILWLSQGLILPLTRLTEPFFFKIVIKRIKSIQWPCSRSQRNTKVERLNDLTFLDRGIEESDLGVNCDAIGDTSMTLQSETSRHVLDDDTTDSKKDEEEELEMKPMFLELASSLNVELVYIILKSITQFAFVSASTHS